MNVEKKISLKKAYEFDFVYARGMYCYLINKPKLKRKIKKSINKKQRISNNSILRNHDY